jgi:2-haloacid dehalogenase
VGTAEVSGVAFDLGGVLLDWNPRHLYRQLFDDPAEMEFFLGTICTPQWHRAHDLGADVTQSCRELAQLHPRYASQIMAWAERNEEMAPGQIDSAVQVLSELKNAGLPCFALSNMEPGSFAIRMDRFDFMRCFDGYVISGIEGVAKPDHRIFRLLLDRYRLAPEATVFIDDNEANVAAARRLGIVGIHFTSAEKLGRDLGNAGLAAFAE